jgi:hypothetical protein
MIGSHPQLSRLAKSFGESCAGKVIEVRYQPGSRERIVELVLARHEGVELVFMLRLAASSSDLNIFVASSAGLRDQVAFALALRCIYGSVPDVPDSFYSDAVLVGGFVAGFRDLENRLPSNLGKRKILDPDAEDDALSYLRQLAEFAVNRIGPVYKQFCSTRAILAADEGLMNVNPGLKGAILARLGMTSEFEAWAATVTARQRGPVENRLVYEALIHGLRRELALNARPPGD